MSIKFYFSWINIIESHKKFYHCCLTSTCWSYNCYLLTCLNVSVKVIYNNVIRIVSEMYMFEINNSLNIFNRNRIFSNLVFLFFLKKFENSFCCCHHWLHHISNLGNLCYRLCKVLNICYECLNITDCNRSVNCKERTWNSYSNIS